MTVDPLIGLRDPALADRVELLHAWPAERYERAAPCAVHYDGDATRAAYAAQYANRRAALGASALVRLRDVQVQGKGLMMMDGRILRENVEGPSPEFLRQAAARRESPRTVVDEPVFYSTKYGVRNYGHCLLDIVPRIAWFARRYPKVRIVLHTETLPVTAQILGMLGIGGERLLFLDDRPALLREAYFIEPWNRNPLVHGNNSFESMRELKQLATRAPSRGLPRRIFVTRDDARTRRLINLKAVKAYLSGKGYEALNCGDLPFSEQVRRFDAAEEIVGISGAALSNLVFCRAGTRVLNLAPASMPSLFFWDLAHHAALRYAIGYFAAHGARGGIHVDFEVDLGALRTLFEARW